MRIFICILLAALVYYLCVAFVSASWVTDVLTWGARDRAALLGGLAVCVGLALALGFV